MSGSAGAAVVNGAPVSIPYSVTVFGGDAPFEFVVDAVTVGQVLFLCGWDGAFYEAASDGVRCVRVLRHGFVCGVVRW